MTQEEKQLLLVDLCARLPYGVECKDDYAQIEGKLCQIGTNYNMCLLSDEYGESKWAYIPNCKPYLFPLSSMTEEQSKEFEEIDPEFYSLICGNGDIYVSMDIRGYDWLNKNHFDYRGLIPMGLSIDATGLNIY